MKRVALCAAVLLVIILLCTAESRHGIPLPASFYPSASDLEQAVYQETFERLSGQAADICRDWLDAEHVLIRFVRHAELDEVTGAMTRLEMLAKYGDLSEFSAELNRIKNLLHHIYDSEIPYLRNIF